MQITQWGHQDTCPGCGADVQWVHVAGAGYQRRYDLERRNIHRCPAHRLTPEDTWQHKVCLCGALVLANDAGTHKRDMDTGEPHVCRTKAAETPKVSAQQGKAVAQRVAEKPASQSIPRGVVIV